MKADILEEIKRMTDMLSYISDKVDSLGERISELEFAFSLANEEEENQNWNNEYNIMDEYYQDFLEEDFDEDEEPY